MQRQGFEIVADRPAARRTTAVRAVTDNARTTQAVEGESHHRCRSRERQGQVFGLGPALRARLRFQIADQAQREVELLAPIGIGKTFDGVVAAGQSDGKLRARQNNRPKDEKKHRQRDQSAERAGVINRQRPQARHNIDHQQGCAQHNRGDNRANDQRGNRRFSNRKRQIEQHQSRTEDDYRHDGYQNTDAKRRPLDLDHQRAEKHGQKTNDHGQGQPQQTQQQPPAPWNIVINRLIPLSPTGGAHQCRQTQHQQHAHGKGFEPKAQTCWAQHRDKGLNPAADQRQTARHRRLTQHDLHRFVTGNARCFAQQI